MIYDVWMMHFVFACQPTDIFPVTYNGLCRSSFLTHTWVWQTTRYDNSHLEWEGCWTVSHHILRVMMATEVTERSIAKQKLKYLAVRFFGGGKNVICVCVCFSAVSSFWRETPGGSPPILCISRQEDRHLVSTWTSGSRERDTLPEKGFCKCVHPLKTFLCCSSTPYITHAALFTTPPPPTPLPCMTAKHLPHLPPHPPTPCSSHHPLTWLQTNKNLRSPVILYLVFVGGFSLRGMTVWQREISSSIFFFCCCQKHFSLI